MLLVNHRKWARLSDYIMIFIYNDQPHACMLSHNVDVDVDRKYHRA